MAHATKARQAVKPGADVLPQSLALGDGFEDARVKLRRDRRVFILDDSQASCTMSQRILNPLYGGATEYMTDPVAAVEVIAGKVAKGELDVLVLDMDMPGLSGRQVMGVLAQRGLFPPTVIVSGGQGTTQAKRFLSEVSAAKSMIDLRAAVDGHMKSTQGLAIAYVPKEMVALDERHLVNAVDAMAVASGKRAKDLDLVLASLRVDTLGAFAVDETVVAPIFAQMADEALAFISGYRRFLGKLKGMMGTITPVTENIRGKSLTDYLDYLDTRFAEPSRYSFDEFRRRGLTLDWSTYRHDLMGSQGVHGIEGSLGGLCEFLRDDDCRRIKSLMETDYLPVMKAFVTNFERLEVDMFDTAGPRKIDPSDIFGRLIALEVVVSKSEGRFQMESPGDYLRIAMQQAVTNAAAATQGMKGYRLRAKFETVKVDDAGRARQHFLERGYAPDEEVGMIRISDKAGGIPDDILAKFEAGRPIEKDGRVCCGLELMRETISYVNDGIVFIEKTEGGTDVVFYVGLKKRQTPG